MNQMEIFKTRSLGRSATVEIDGEPWLVGKDVALALGVQKPARGDSQPRLTQRTKG